MATGSELFIDLYCPFTPQYKQLHTLLQCHLHQGLRLNDMWITLTSSYCVPTSPVSVMAAEKTTVVAKAVKTNCARVTLEEVTVTETASAASPFCMTIASGQIGGGPTNVILAHVYLDDKMSDFNTDVTRDVQSSITQWINEMGLDPTLTVQVFLTLYHSAEQSYTREP